MSTSYTRRRDPAPMGQGWETAVATLAAVAALLGLAALAGLGVAGAVFGGGWVCPRGTDTIGRTVAGLLTGHPGHGLPASRAALVPGPVPVYGCIAVCELALLAGCGYAAVLVARYRRPGDARRGMATRREAHQALGLGRLRTAKTLIRPDLYGHHHHQHHRAKENDS